MGWASARSCVILNTPPWTEVYNRRFFCIHCILYIFSFTVTDLNCKCKLWLSSGTDHFATSLIPGHLGHWYWGIIIITIIRMKLKKINNHHHITLKQYSQYIYVTALILWDSTNLYTSTTWTVGAKCHHFQGLEDPAEPVLRTFVLPKLPEEGEHFHVSVKHLWTPNEVIWQTWREQTVADFHSLHEHKV